jgi:hypothetical protein
MIGRIWHGWTKPDNANRYERLLKEEIFPGIADKKVPGTRSGNASSTNRGLKDSSGK